MKALIGAIGLLLLGSCSTKEKTTQQSTEQTVAEAPKNDSTQTGGTVSTKSAIKATVAAGAGKWAYEKKTDKEGKPVYKASLVASNILEFSFPYNGGSVATLTIRKRESGTTVYIEVSKGQFNRSFQGGKARIRFDRQSPVAYELVAAENGRANIVFFDAEQKLINQMKAAKEMVIDLDFAGQGVRQLLFKTAGLKWS
ncbi:hypothetical protein WBJ53_10915 [Spirosoma sp. SC4-14]|uniref:hypothetical protein n=1 Tax=Spirosoma sp. SC4-14 TaxID=3128900 RepID=UPI0030D11A09